MLKHIVLNGSIKFGNLKNNLYICNMKITKYGHSWILMVLGILFTSSDSLLSSFIGGILIGTSVLMARQSGIEDASKNE